jgi:hypothetical protein
MRKIILLILASYLFFIPAFGQVIDNAGNHILFQGLVMDAGNFSTISGTQIAINRKFSAVSNKDGAFAFYVNRNDTVVFNSLGYSPSKMIISDTLEGREFVAGIYMKSDTLTIGEVIIVPRFSNLKSEILNGKSKAPSTLDNAKYNVAVSAYQGRNSVSQLGDPASNYDQVRRTQKISAFEKGGIRPSDQFITLNALSLIPAAYLLIKGKPEMPDSYKPDLSPYELEMIQKKYLEAVKKHK